MEVGKKARFVCQFALDDFKTKYAGSMFGILWAFAQPIITVLIYWFIFQIGFKNPPVQDVPFIIWLVTGIVPWFFISDAITNATVSFVEYKYLVKKVVFNIDILPVAKIISIVMIQVVLVVLALVFSMVYGVKPNLCWLQLIYYMTYMIILCVGIGYLMASFYVFFKDILQLISVALQLGFWLTPIVWNIQIMPANIQSILAFNPIFYVVNGYRESIAFHGHIWDISPLMTAYYWIVAIGLLLLGNTIFRKLKPVFADVL